MTRRLRIAITADLHWGSRAAGDEATRLLRMFLQDSPPDVLVLAGDVGSGAHFDACLELFASLPCHKALVPGNHDLWVTATDPRGDSLDVYRQHLPARCAAHGFHYLDQAPLLLTEARLALVGSINWYDYSWSIEALRRDFPEAEARLYSKRFTRGQHNDANFIRWPIDDGAFTQEVVSALEKHLKEALRQCDNAIAFTHHPPYYGLSFPRLEPPRTMDGLLWDAFSGNRSMEALLGEHAPRIDFAFCGHTHRACDNTLAGIRGYNIGGDYHFKRLLMLDWPEGAVSPHVFGTP
jgi:predicted phosphohydrolase